MRYEFLTVEKKNRVATCTIRWPPMNYMNADARNAMKAWLEGKPYEFEGE